MLNALYIERKFLEIVKKDRVIDFEYYLKEIPHLDIKLGWWNNDLNFMEKEILLYLSNFPI